MTIHHDKTVYGKLASQREDIDERGIEDMLCVLNAEEVFDVVDANGVPTGETVGREEAHAKGIRHRTAHVWLWRKKDGRAEILLQKRAENRDYPGCYDISAAGHLHAGESALACALRELEEELGVIADADDLCFCGRRTFCFRGKGKDGRPFIDNQVSDVYLFRSERDAADFLLDPSETERVIWVEFEDCRQKVSDNAFLHCIYPEELEILEKFLQI